MNSYVVLCAVPVTQEMLVFVYLGLVGKVFLGGLSGLAEMVFSDGREVSTFLSDHLI